MTTLQHRVDIQALRGIAVLLVVFYHARLIPISNGHFGVDIFFVISGFLISSQLFKQIENEQFSFKQFYLRRAWRLLPAAYTVIAVSLIAAPWALTHAEMNDLVQQVWGALSFTANFFLWSQTGYFESSAELKPLLHMWSLSIEEQYYLVTPALLVLIPRRHWFKAIVLLTVISMVTYLMLLEPKPGASFYFTPTRVWELGIGSMLAYCLHTNAKPTKPRPYLAILACSIAILGVAYSFEGVSANRVNLLAVVFATAVVIACEPKWLHQGVLAIWLARVGTISYSLYLVHWPILSLLRNVNISGEDLWWPFRVLAVIVSFICAAALYHLIENRFRITDETKLRRFTPMVLASCLIIALSLTVQQLSGGEKYTELFRPNIGLDETCRSPNFYEIPACKTSDKPSTLIWGDSYAMHLVPGIKASDRKGLIQATFSTCVPIKGISFYQPPQHGLSWAHKCLSFNQSAIDYAIKNPDIELVVIASLWTHMLNVPLHVKNTDDKPQTSQLNKGDITGAIIRTVSTLKSAGKKVVLVAPPPSLGFNIAKCHEQRDREQFRIGSQEPEDCRLDYNKYLEREKRLNAIFEKLRENNIAIYSFAEKLCNDEFCDTKLDGVILYQDRGHLSISGSIHYAQKFSMHEELNSLAN